MQEIKRIVLLWFGAGVEKGAIPAPLESMSTRFAAQVTTPKSHQRQKSGRPAPKLSDTCAPKCAPTSALDGHDALLIFRQLQAMQDFGFCMILSLFATD